MYKQMNGIQQLNKELVNIKRRIKNKKESKGSLGFEEWEP